MITERDGDRKEFYYVGAAVVQEKPSKAPVKDVPLRIHCRH